MAEIFLQRGLFPEAFEAEADALEALEELDVDQGLRRLAEVRRRALDLANLDEIESALLWLDGALRGARPTLERVAAAFLDLPRAQLSAGAAHFADRALARYGTRRAHGRSFLDEEERVPVAALSLVLRRDERARRELATLVREHGERADLLGWLADACTGVERFDEACEGYVRALLLDPSRMDLFRLREPRLRALLAELASLRPIEEARELLFAEAWLRGILAVPPGNGWLDTSVARLLAAARAVSESPSAGRSRRFSLLLYLDRSAATGSADLAAREVMQDLEPDLFRRFVAVLREREVRGKGA